MTLHEFLGRRRLTQAERYLAQGRLRSAAGCIGKVSGDLAQGRRAWRLRARLLVLVGRPVAAVACFERTLKTGEATLDDLLELAALLLHVREFDRAEAVLLRFLARSPGHRLAVTLLAHVFRAQGRYRAAYDVLRKHRPKAAIAMYANAAPPAPKRSWQGEKMWRQAVRELGRDPEDFRHPSRSAADPNRRDDLSDLFDEMARTPRMMRALAWAACAALSSDAPWLLRYVRRAASYVKLDVPRTLPMFIARHGGIDDRDLLLAGLAEGGETRLLSAAALVSLGFDEFDEVLRDLHERGSRDPVPEQAWTEAVALAGRPLSV